MRSILYFLLASGLSRIGLRRWSDALYLRFISRGEQAEQRGDGSQVFSPAAVRFFCKSLGLLQRPADRRRWLEAFFEAQARLREGKPAEPHGLPGRLVVSLTSYPKRFDVVYYTLRSLLNQNMRADAIMLWVAHADRAALPQEVLALQELGVGIRYCDDLRSYKKIIPLLQQAAQEGRQDFIVTVDDDTYYPPDWLARLVAQAVAYPGHIIAHRAHEVRLDAQGAPLPYRKWNRRITSMQGLVPALIFPTGVGGVLYPPGVFHTEVLDEEKFRRLAPMADDVWLYWMWRMNGKLAQLVEGESHMPVFAQWPSSQSGALRASNAHQGGNDVQIRNMVAAYGLGVFRT
jgi:hypothetical protein